MGNESSKPRRCVHCKVPLPIGTPLKSCDLHTCQVNDCLEPKDTNSTWGCGYHACRYCDKPRDDEAHEMSDCVCSHKGCVNIVMYNLSKGSKYSYCKGHKCEVEGCDNVRIKKTCGEHTCGVDRCREPKAYGSDWCKDHVCRKCKVNKPTSWPHCEPCRSKERIIKKMQWSPCCVCTEVIGNQEAKLCESCEKTMVHFPKCMPRDFRCPTCRQSMFEGVDLSDVDTSLNKLVSTNKNPYQPKLKK